MIDFNGNEIYGGDTVIYIARGYREYAIGFVVGFTKNFVKVLPFENKDKDSILRHEFKQEPSQLIKIELNEYHKSKFYTK